MQPTLTAHLFPKLSSRLSELLRGLTSQQWSAPAVKHWSVKDVVAHLLDTSLRRLSIGRDHHWGESFNGNTPADFKAFLHKLNHDWVAAMRRVSPRVLCELVEQSEFEVANYFAGLDPYGSAPFAVSWAGEERSENWFDIAREFTERWHHQQQIRDAVGETSILTEELYVPVLDTFVRALPISYKSMKSERGTSVSFEVNGEVCAEWVLVFEDMGWKLMKGAAENPSCRVSMQAEVAWKLFTNGLTIDQAKQKLKVTGETKLANPCFSVRAIAT